MEKNDLLKIAEQISAYFETEVEEVYLQQQETDAGFSLKNGITLQYAPYMGAKPYCVGYFNGSASYDLNTFQTVPMMLKHLGDVKHKFEAIREAISKEEGFKSNKHVNKPRRCR